MIGSTLKSIQISGVQILNWADDKMQNTLHRELMMVESITPKKLSNLRLTSKDDYFMLFYQINEVKRSHSTSRRPILKKLGMWHALYPFSFEIITSWNQHSFVIQI